MKINRFGTLILSFLLVFGSASGETCTTLELALTKAFNAKVEDGTYARLFSDLVDIKSTSFCTGNAARWETPKLDDGNGGQSDLAAAIERGYLTCGYPKDLFFQQSLEAGQVLLDTIDPNNVQGVLVDWWDELGKELGRMYGKSSFDVKWNASFANSQQVLSAVQNGTFDVACARWAPDGFWTDTSGAMLPRSIAFSTQLCSTYAQMGHIYTKLSSNITTFEQFIQAIDNGTVRTITADGSTGGGTPATCSNQLSIHTARPVTCVGVTGNSGFARLDSGESDAHWEGVPEFASLYHRFDQPALYTPVTLFRRKDVSRQTSDAVTAFASLAWTLVGPLIAMLI